MLLFHGKLEARPVVESYVFYSSLTMIAMGCLALGLSVLFRRRLRSLNSLPRDLSATVFNRTFVVFDPYPQQTKLIHDLLLALPFLAFFVTLGLTLALWKMLASGLILSVLTVIISLNVMIIEEAPEVYMNSSIFIGAIQKGTNLAGGDLKALRLIKSFASKLSKYYLAIGIFLIAFAAGLPDIWIAVPWTFRQLIDLIARSSGSNQTVVIPITVILPALSLFVLQLAASKVKNRIFRHETE